MDIEVNRRFWSPAPPLVEPVSFLVNGQSQKQEGQGSPRVAICMDNSMKTTFIPGLYKATELISMFSQIVTPSYQACRLALSLAPSSLLGNSGPPEAFPWSHRSPSTHGVTSPSVCPARCAQKCPLQGSKHWPGGPNILS